MNARIGSNAGVSIICLTVRVRMIIIIANENRSQSADGQDHRIAGALGRREETS